MENFILTNVLILWLVLTANFLLTLALIRQINALHRRIRMHDTLRVGEKAPNFTIQGLEGRSVEAGSYAGKAFALIIVDPDCLICRENMAVFNEKCRQAHECGLDLVLVSLGSVTKTQQLAKDFNIQSPIYLAPRDGTFTTQYKVHGTPTYYLINKHNRVQAAGAGTIDWDELTTMS